MLRQQASGGRQCEPKCDDWTRAGVVVAVFSNTDDTMRVVQGCHRVFFSVSVSDAYLETSLNMVAAAKFHDVDLNVSSSTSRR